MIKQIYLLKKPNKHLANNKNEQQEHRMQTLLSPKCVKMHPIEVNDQLEENYESKWSEVMNQLKQQEDVKVEHQPQVEKKIGKISNLA